MTQEKGAYTINILHKLGIIMALIGIPMGLMNGYGFIIAGIGILLAIAAERSEWKEILAYFGGYFGKWLIGILVVTAFIAWAFNHPSAFIFVIGAVVGAIIYSGAKEIR